MSTVTFTADIIERGAKALFGQDQYSSHSPTWQELDDHDRQEYRDAVHVVLLAALDGLTGEDLAYLATPRIAVPDTDWRLIQPGQYDPPRLCRLPRCRQVAVAELGRRTRRGERFETVRWWAYCGDHLYGRWIDDGQVMKWTVASEGGQV